MFAAKISYGAGTSYTFRQNGKKWVFPKNKPRDCDDREVARKCRAIPGFSVRVLVGSLEDPEPQEAAPEPKKLVPKKIAATKRKVSKTRTKKK